jgi:predicted ATPase
LEAHNSLGATLSHTGDFALSREHLEQGVTLYDPQLHRSHAFLYGQDPGVVCLIRLSYVLWCLGYPEQGLERSRQALALARELSHPFSLAFALSYAALLHHLRRSAPAAWDAAQSAIALSTEQGFPMFVLMGTLVKSSALVERGQAEEAIAHLLQGLGAAKPAGAEMLQSYGLGVLAHAYGKVGRDEEGLAALAQALDAAHGAGDRFYEAELHRLKGELLLKRVESGNNSQVAAAEPSWLTEAEACFHQAINVARRQQAKSLELRAVISLSRLCQKQGNREEARQMLDESYNWFTEGFDSKDLKEAKELIENVS